MSKKNATGSPEQALRELAGDSDRLATELATRFADRAAAEGLLDVAYTVSDSPFGELLLAATPRGLLKVALPNQDVDLTLEQISRQVSPRVLELPSRLDDARRELDRYFEGKVEEFDLPLDWALTRGFRRKVLRQTARIPYGETRSYMEMAKRAGSPRAIRAAGSALGSNPIPIVVPCHRVLRTGGALGGYGGGLDMKQALLQLEGAL